MLQVGLEDLTRGRPFDRLAHGPIPLTLMLASKVTFFPQLVARHAHKRPLSPPRPPVQGCQRCVLAPISSPRTPTARHGDLPSDQNPPSRPQELVSLARTHRPFFRLHPRRLSIRLTVDSLTRTPTAFSRNSRRSERVAGGRLSRSASKSFVALSSILGLEPGLFFGARESPSCANF